MTNTNALRDAIETTKRRITEEQGAIDKLRAMGRVDNSTDMVFAQAELERYCRLLVAQTKRLAAEEKK